MYTRLKISPTHVPLTLPVGNRCVGRPSLSGTVSYSIWFWNTSYLPGPALVRGRWRSGSRPWSWDRATSVSLPSCQRDARGRTMEVSFLTHRPDQPCQRRLSHGLVCHFIRWRSFAGTQILLQIINKTNSFIIHLNDSAILWEFHRKAKVTPSTDLRVSFCNL